MTSIKKSEAILNGLLHNEEYSKEVLPFIKSEYFDSKSERVVVDTLLEYTSKYSDIPSHEELFVDVQKRKDMTEDDMKSFKDLYEKALTKKFNSKFTWLKDLTEKYCKDRALFLAITKSIQIYEEPTKKDSRDSIPDLIRDALSVSFENTIGHDYFGDAEKRHDFYNDKEELVPFRLPILNKITAGGVPFKTLNIFMGGTNTFKTGFLCDLAAGYLHDGYDVLYITLEMAEEKIAERIDANLTKLRIPEVKTLLKPLFLEKIAEIKSKTAGRLFIKEYPTSSANANHFRVLLKELDLKQDFRPKIVIVDYLSICASIRASDASNLYSYNKAIAEELRGLAQEKKIILWSGMQTNRSGQDSSDLSLENTSESHGVPMTTDLMWGIINTEELESKGLIMIKQLKSRYEDKSKYRRIILGVDKERMTVYEPDQRAIEGFDLNPENEIHERKVNKTDVKLNKPKTTGFKF